MATASSVEPGGIRAWHLFLVVGLAGASAAVVVAGDRRVENLVTVSVAILAAIGAGVAFHQTLMPFGGAGIEDEGTVLSARARAALEREKVLVLRTIKELEFDKAMGKIAEVDFQEMVGRLRGRAIGIMKQLDIEAEGYRGLIERDLRARLDEAGVKPSPAPPETRSAGAAAAPSTLACAACGTTNDHDARFCKNCGAKLDAFAVSV